MATDLSTTLNSLTHQVIRLAHIEQILLG